MYTTIQQQYAAAAAAAIAAANANAHHPYQQQHQSGTDNALSTGAADNATSSELVAAGKKRSAENDIFQLVFSLSHYDMILFPLLLYYLHLPRTTTCQLVTICVQCYPQLSLWMFVSSIRPPTLSAYPQQSIPSSTLCVCSCQCVSVSVCVRVYILGRTMRQAVSCAEADIQELIAFCKCISAWDIFEFNPKLICRTTTTCVVSYVTDRGPTVHQDFNN